MDPNNNEANNKSKPVNMQHTNELQLADRYREVIEQKQKLTPAQR